jgi:hypothetical protein
MEAYISSSSARRVGTCLRLSVLMCLMTGMSGCKYGSTSGPRDSEQKFMSENSRRRLATADETVGIYKLKTYGGNWCTAFSVRNEGGLPIIMSARHCTNLTPEDWCSKVSVIMKASEEKTYKCTRILFNPSDLDFFAMLVDQPLDDKGLTLSAVDPAAGVHLRMTGFPTDSFGKSLGGPVTTDNCWVLSASKQRAAVATKISPPPLAMNHNCSTYGGNSGGPMLVEGTDIVVGEPATYIKNSEFQNSFRSGAYFYTVADLIKNHPDYISAHKLVTTSSLPAGERKTQYIPELKCTSPQQEQNPILHLVPLYRSESEINGVKIKFKSTPIDKYGAVVEYASFNGCDDKGKCGNGEFGVVEIKSATEVVYTKDNKVATFTCEPYQK